MTTPIVVTSPAELRDLVTEAVAEALADLAPAAAPPALLDRAGHRRGAPQ